MKISLAKCKSILDTLPIGLYTGRRIIAELSDQADTSYYSMMEDKIVVSYKIIDERLSKAINIPNEEEAIRSMLYHEVSHAILTPIVLSKTNTSEEMMFAINCVEDERIETVLANYYHGVNFKQQLYDLHNNKIPVAKDKQSAFFNAVRFRKGTPQVINKVERLIKDYATLHRNSPEYSRGREVSCSDYKWEIKQLWDLITEEYPKDPNAFNQPQQNNQDSENESDNNNNEDKATTDQNMSMLETMVKSVAVSERQIKELIAESLNANFKLNSAECEEVNKFMQTAENIIRNFNKKNSGGSGINSYSGVFNPRAIVRQDYKFFERSMSTRGNNKFGSCHLNLIIDCSGSYYNNVNITNGILAALSEIERKNANFSMDVAFINNEFHICKTPSEREMNASGGNKIPSDMKQIMLKLQKPQTCNYNIVLFDGDAASDEYASPETIRAKFAAFNMKQTTLITDPDNTQYMNPPFNTAKVVVTTNYTEELINNITNALTIAFG